VKQKTPAYAILRTKPQRLGDLMKLEDHNNRTIPVAGADPTMENGIKTVRMDGVNACCAVLKRIQDADAKQPGRGRIHAFEAVATVSPDSDPMPTDHELEMRGTRFFDEEFGRENVVGIWLHLDEKTPHLHALIVPVCEALPPGRPHRNGARKKRLIVSWNQFSGSCDRSFRREQTVACSTGKTAITINGNRQNPTMANWQTNWANIWADYGLRRGAPSLRGHLPNQQIQAQKSRIAGQSKSVLESICTDIRSIATNPSALTKLLQIPSVEDLAVLLPTTAQHVNELEALAAKGIQLDVERQARADLADLHQATKADLEVYRAAQTTPNSADDIADRKAEVHLLRGEIGHLTQYVEILETILNRREIDNYTGLWGQGKRVPPPELSGPSSEIAR